MPTTRVEQQLIKASHGTAKHRQRAQAAIQQGQFAAKGLQAHLKGDDPGPFIFRDLGEMLSLGIGDASLTGLGITLAGPLAFKLRRLTYLTRLPGLSLGLKAAGAWLVSP